MRVKGGKGRVKEGLRPGRIYSPSRARGCATRTFGTTGTVIRDGEKLTHPDGVEKPRGGGGGDVVMRCVMVHDFGAFQFGTVGGRQSGGDDHDCEERVT